MTTLLEDYMSMAHEEFHSILNQLEFYEVSVYYSVSFSQGDGACFVGKRRGHTTVDYKDVEPNLPEWAKGIVFCHKNLFEEESIDIQIRRINGHYCHSKTIVCESLDNGRGGVDYVDYIQEKESHFLEFARDISDAFYEYLCETSMEAYSSVSTLLGKHGMEATYLSQEEMDLYHGLTAGNDEFYLYGSSSSFIETFKKIAMSECPNGYHLAEDENGNHLWFQKNDDGMLSSDTVMWIFAPYSEWAKEKNKCSLNIGQTSITLHVSNDGSVFMYEAECADMYVKCQYLSAFQKFLKAIEDESYLEKE